MAGGSVESKCGIELCDSGDSRSYAICGAVVFRKCNQGGIDLLWIVRNPKRNAMDHEIKIRLKTPSRKEFIKTLEGVTAMRRGSTFSTLSNGLLIEYVVASIHGIYAPNHDEMIERSKKELKKKYREGKKIARSLARKPAHDLWAIVQYYEDKCRDSLLDLISALEPIIDYIKKQKEIPVMSLRLFDGMHLIYQINGFYKYLAERAIERSIGVTSQPARESALAAELVRVLVPALSDVNSLRVKTAVFLNSRHPTIPISPRSLSKLEKELKVEAASFLRFILGGDNQAQNKIREVLYKSPPKSKAKYDGSYELGSVTPEGDIM